MDREWILLNPGPANTTASVKQALVMPDLCHREPECFEMMRRCREMLVTLAGAGPDWAAVLFAGSGGYIIYAGQGEIAKYGFRVANMGTLTPSDMAKVVQAFAATIEELRRR